MYEYHDWAHYTGPVTVMGWSHANGSAKKGYDVALKYIDYLAHHPSTATRIATKLCQRFVSDAPPPALVDSLAETYLAHDTAIVPVLRKLFGSSAFKNSVGEKVRRPFQDVMATVRVLGIKPEASADRRPAGMYWMLDGLGDLPMGWIPPNGYPDYADAWRSAGSTLGRWNMHRSAAVGGWPFSDAAGPRHEDVLLRFEAPEDLRRPRRRDGEEGWCSASSHPPTAPRSSRSSEKADTDIVDERRLLPGLALPLSGRADPRHPLPRDPVIT